MTTPPKPITDDDLIYWRGVCEGRNPELHHPYDFMMLLIDEVKRLREIEWMYEELKK
jgi:hypothetical protein